MKACDHAVYLHHLIGGPKDGEIVPGPRPYETIHVGTECTWDGKEWQLGGKVTLYVSTGEEPTPCEPKSWEAISCSEEYVEFVYFRVTMKYKPE